MCGIAGFVGGFQPGLMARMNAAQAHRGPDGSGVFEDAEAEAALAHVRLAILDLSDQASQPMFSRDGRYVLVFNGEIYNYRELRASLGAGEPFQSSGDTEVLLRGLERYGPEFVSKLNGMFAFALWDRRERQLLLARDHLGIKPLYYTEPKPGQLLFASELKALCAHPDVSREPDLTAISQHLAFCHCSSTRTALKGVRRVPPATLLRWNARDRRIQMETYWRPLYGARTNRDRTQAIEELRSTMTSAVRRQLVSDVPVGTFLSGGLDSSLITALGAKDANDDFHSYTITYSASQNRLDQVDEDGPHARALARRMGLSLREVEIGPEIVAEWPRLIYHLDEPIADPAAISCYLISRLARESGTTVLLSGQGVDELFGGYPRYRAMDALQWCERVPRSLRRVISRGATRLPSAWTGKAGAMMRRTRRVLAELEQPPAARFLAYCASTPEHEIHNILSPEVREQLAGCSVADDCIGAMQSSGYSGMEMYLDRDLSIYLPNHNLLYTDKMGMAVGLESRVPLLDIEWVNLITQFPANWKISGATTKVLLREAARGIVPDRIIDRPKAGFGAPYRKWLREDLAELWEDLTCESSVRNRGWFSYEGLQQARQRSQSGSTDLYMLQWAVLTLELWARQFLDANPATTRIPESVSATPIVRVDGKAA